MATRKTKNSDTERLDSASIERAIEYLENKGTKKGACEILNISYNTTRLDKLIQKYIDEKIRVAEKKAEKRGKPATPQEISYAIQAYLEGIAIDSIASALYRNPSFIKNILIKYEVPLRNIPHSYFKPELVPEGAMREKFKIGEKVYSMRYDCLAEIKSEFKPGIYSIFLLAENQKQFAYQEASELASLEHLTALGVNL